jgi:Rhodopirellula transposase DDE domain
MSPQETIKQKFEQLRPVMDERVCRLWAATEAQALGWGGVTLVAQATGVSRKRIGAGLRELRALAAGSSPPPWAAARVRRPGGGRKSKTETDPTLLGDLEALVEPLTRGDPMSPLRWTCKSTHKLAAALRERGHAVSHETVRQLLLGLDYRLQAPCKTREGSEEPDRNAQFEQINAAAERFQAAGQPVISVDTKKKELVGDFANGGREWQPSGMPEAVRVHDFPDKELGKVSPYGVFDLAANVGYVSVGIDHDTAAFAVHAIQSWWAQMGRAMYPTATELLITADCGGSNGNRVKLWKTELQRFADASGLTIQVCHFPPGTSKWNKIEHQLFCHITQNWRGRPLISHETIVELIGSTTTSQGLQVRAALDRNPYPTGIKVSDAELAAVRLEPATFHGEWNYTIRPTHLSLDTLIS